MKFADIPNNVKAAVAIAGLAVAAFTYHEQFITEAEASQSARIQWINNLEAELRTLRRQLRITSNPETREFLEEDIRELEKKLECVREADEDKVQFC